MPAVSNITLSFKPKRNSGIPERKHFILIEPKISLLNTLPLLLTYLIKYIIFTYIILNILNISDIQKIIIIYI